jgi:hypothetical protein
MAGFLEFDAGPMGVRVTPDLRFYAYSFYTDLENLGMTDLGKSWWKWGKATDLIDPLQKSYLTVRGSKRKYGDNIRGGGGI